MLGGGADDVPLQDQNQASVVSADPSDEDDRSTGCSGCMAGVCETLSLFCILPGFWRLCLFQFFSSAGACLPAIYYMGPLSTQIWKTHATNYSLWSNAGHFFVAIFGAPLFGMWSDGRPRKTSLLIVAVAGLARVVPFVVDHGAIGLWASVPMNAITSPFVSQLSGSPVVWAWTADVIPQQYRETGFSLVFAVCGFAAWISGIVTSTIVDAYGLDQLTYLYTGTVFLFLALVLIVTMPSKPPAVSAERDPDPLARNKSFKDLMLSPFRLVARKRSLRLLCGVAAFVTLPDTAVTYVALPILYVVLQVNGDTPEMILKQGSLANWFTNFPLALLIIIYFVVGVFSKRFGPARTIMMWTPFTCVAFSAPALLAIPGVDSIPMEVFCGLMLSSPLSIYPPLQALVALLVPPQRVGEAMGAVAACKNVASLVAPLVMNAFVSLFDSWDRQDLYWTLFPGAALFMLLGAWPFTVLLARRMAEGTDTDFKWSFWSEVSTTQSRLSMMGSRADGNRSGHGTLNGSRISAARG